MSVVPTRRLCWALAVPALLALGMLLVPELARLVWLCDALILALALSDAWLARAPLLVLVREAPTVLSLGRPNPVRLSLRSRARRALDVELQDELFEHSSAEGLPARVALSALGSASVEYGLVPRRRGQHRLGPCCVRYASPLGLWQRQLSLGGEQALRVYPDLLALRRFELLARRDRDLDVARVLRQRGGETEFARLRDYASDDEYRSIDWKATARRQRLTAREYQLESNQELLFMLDAGRMMTAEVLGVTQFDHALNAALMLSHVALRTGDRVGLLAFDAALRRYVPPGRGRAAEGRLIASSYDLYPELVESDYDGAFRTLALRQRKRALVVVFSQVLDDAVASSMLRGVRALARHHLPLVVLFRDLDIDALLGPRHDTREELYVRAAAAELCSWRSGFIRDLRHGGALVLDVGPRELTGRLISRYFEVKARHQL